MALRLLPAVEQEYCWYWLKATALSMPSLGGKRGREGEGGREGGRGREREGENGLACTFGFNIIIYLL